MLDTKALAEATAAIVKEHVSFAVAPLLKRIEELEARSVVPGPRGEAGKDGASVNVEDLVPLVAGEVAKAIAAIPAPLDGKDGKGGKDGSSVSLDDVAPLLNDLVAKAVGAIPAPKDGEAGRDAPAPTEEQIAAAVAKHIEADPPKDGKDGRDGIAGEPGKDGVALTDAMIDRDGNLVLALSNGQTKNVGVVVGRDGKDGDAGKDGEKGRDGMNLEDFTAKLSDNFRSLELTWDRADYSYTREVHFPVPIHRGVYETGKTYEHGDMVTYAGSTWHCRRETQDRPDGGSDAWMLAVKRGRDGREVVSIKPEPPKPVKV